MAPVQYRSTPVATTPTFSLAAVVGVAIGAALLLGIVMVSVTLVILRSKHRRAIAKLEQENVTRRLETLENDHVNTIYPPMPSSRGFHFAPNNSTAWGALSSSEDLQNTQSPRRSLRFSPMRKPKDRKESEKLSWPLPKHLKPPGQDVQMKKLKAAHLSSIIESPRNVPKTEMLQENSSEQCLLPGTPSEVVPSVAAQPLYPDESYYVQPNSRTRSMGMEHFRTLGMDPYKSPKRPSSYNTNRSVSVPSLLSQVPENSALNVNGHARTQFRPRSVSLGQLPGVAPTAPLPSLPSNFVLLQKRLTASDLSPRSSISSESSASSAILKIGVSPSMRAVRDFSKRHPEMGLGGKIRDGVSVEVKRSLLGERKQSPDPATIMSQKYLPSHQGSLCDITAPSRTQSVLGKHSADGHLADDLDTHDSTARLSVASGIKVKRISSTQNLLDNPIRLVDSSKHSSLIQSVSRDGSPLERKRSTPNLLPEREAIAAQSRSSPPTAAGSIGVFDWGLSPPTQLEGSSSKRLSSQRRSHGRQGLPRNLVTSNAGGSLSRNNSSITLTGITEESSRGSSANVTRASLGSLSRPPSAGTFAPVLRLDFATPTLNSTIPSFMPNQETSNSLNMVGNTSETVDNETSPSSVGSSIPRFPSPGHSTHTSIISPPQRSSSIPGFVPVSVASPKHESFSGARASDLASSPGSSPHASFLGAPDNPNLETSRAEPEPSTTQSPPQGSKSPSVPLTPTANAFDNAPNFEPPRSAKIPHFSRPSPVVARNLSQVDLMKSIKALRRMNSEYLDISQEDRRYLRMGQDTSPDLLKQSKSNLRSSMLPYDEFGGKENADSQRFSIFWGSDNGGTALQSLSENRRSMTPSPRSSRYSGNYGGKRASFKRNTTGSLYDLDGFLIAER